MPFIQDWPDRAARRPRIQLTPSNWYHTTPTLGSYRVFGGDKTAIAVGNVCKAPACQWGFGHPKTDKRCLPSGTDVAPYFQQLRARAPKAIERKPAPIPKAHGVVTEFEAVQCIGGLAFTDLLSPAREPIRLWRSQRRSRCYCVAAHSPFASCMPKYAPASVALLIAGA
jgi:hypothetical protein